MAEGKVIIYSILIFVVCGAQKFDVTYKFKEEQGPNEYIGSVNRDAKLYEIFSDEEYRNLTYAAFEQEEDDSQRFSIDRFTSSIFANDRMDREQICGQQPECHLKLNVAVYQPVGKSTDLKKILRVLIILVDINDNYPTFPNKDVNITVAESISKNQEILTSGATDEDVGLNSIKSYEILPADGMFELNVMERTDGPADLGLVVKHGLDRETKSVFNVEIIAKDGGSPMKTGHVRIQIHVSDVNDNPPSFISKDFEETVLESAPLNVPILRLVASDPDAGLNSELSYSFTARTPAIIKEYIGINSANGDLFPIKRFDFEAKNEFQFFVQVNDKGNPSKFDQAAVKIKIEDVNDNSPTVNINLPPSGTTLSEDTEIGAFIAHVSVSDNDEGLNRVVACEIPDNHFSLIRFSETSYIFKILLQRSLDYENTSTHLVNVTCHDEGVPKKYGSSSFTLTVKDENDNRPVFSQPEYTVTFMENNQVGDVVFRIAATDRDSGLNKKVSYEKLDDPDMLFSLESNTGLIKANKIFDREQTERAQFKVRAKDFGSPPLTSTVNVLVIIGDENDNVPQFSQPHFSYSVLENKPIGTSVNMLNVTDLDSSANSKLIFTLSGNNRVQEFFTIDSNTGLIRTGKELDREKENKFDMSVEVRDADNPNYKDNTEVTIYVLDENDHNPIINYPNAVNNTIYVPYTKPAGTVAAIIKAHDLDSDENGELTFSIQTGNLNSVFFMNPRSGEIVISRTLSLEDSTKYKLMISVKDNGEEPKTTYSELNMVVTIGNGSLATYHKNPQEVTKKEDNTAIVLTIVIVTLVLALAIIVIILIVCRIDKNKKKKAAAKNTIIRYDSPASESTYSTSEGQDCDSEKQLKPERVYTLRESSVSSDGSTQSLPFPTMEQSLLKPSSRSGSSQSLKARTTSNTVSETPEEAYRHTNNIHMWLQDQTLTKIPEDSTSQLSGGTEVSERDSGRGTSEEDSKIYHSDPDEPRLFHSPHNNGSKRVRFTDHSKVPPQIPMTGQRTPLTYLQNGQNPKSPRDTVSRNIANSFRNSKNSVGGYEPRYAPPPPPRSKHTYPSNYNDIYNNSISESVNEDDDSTTTSGSYTIANAYDLCNDIDNLFFKDSGTTVV